MGSGFAISRVGAGSGSKAALLGGDAGSAAEVPAACGVGVGAGVGSLIGGAWLGGAGSLGGGAGGSGAGGAIGGSAGAIGGAGVSATPCASAGAELNAAHATMESALNLRDEPRKRRPLMEWWECSTARARLRSWKTRPAGDQRQLNSPRM